MFKFVYFYYQEIILTVLYCSIEVIFSSMLAAAWVRY